jgi:hypothetical protein
MTAPTYHEACAEEFNNAEFHSCLLEAGHAGPHECDCGFEWEQGEQNEAL